MRPQRGGVGWAKGKLLIVVVIFNILLVVLPGAGGDGGVGNLTTWVRGGLELSNLFFEKSLEERYQEGEYCLHESLKPLCEALKARANLTTLTEAATRVDLESLLETRARKKAARNALMEDAFRVLSLATCRIGGLTNPPRATADQTVIRIPFHISRAVVKLAEELGRNPLLGYPSRYLAARCSKVLRSLLSVLPIFFSKERRSSKLRCVAQEVFGVENDPSALNLLSDLLPSTGREIMDYFLCGSSWRWGIVFEGSEDLDAVPAPPNPVVKLADGLSIQVQFNKEFGVFREVQGRQLSYTATKEVEDAIQGMGRTEDVVFSPSNRRLAVGDFHRGDCFVMDVNITRNPSDGKLAIHLSNLVRINTIPSLHGMAFYDEDTLLLVSRIDGGLRAATLTSSPAFPFTLTNNETIQDLFSPGSVAVLKGEPNLKEVLVCDNYVHRVVRFRIAKEETESGTPTLRVIEGSHLLRAKLSIPDGISLSHTERWIAISNHAMHNALLFRNDETLGPTKDPDGEFWMEGYPHGNRFTSDGKYLLVAEASSVYVHVYRSDSPDEWGIHGKPWKSVRVKNELPENPAEGEGGTKGLAIDDAMNVMVLTSEGMALAFFDLQEILQQ